MTVDLAMDATLVTLTGFRAIAHQSKRCAARRSCGMGYAYNFAWVGDKKLNTVALSDIDALFVTGRWAFDVKYLEYHEALHFRGCLSTRALSWATEIGRAHV